MMNIPVYNFFDSRVVQTYSLRDDVWAVDFKESLIYQVLRNCVNSKRSGNHAQKTRSEVRGGGRKPYRQKGTGRARAGSNRSPIWRGGGVIFAAQKRDYSSKVNKKMYRSAMRSILSELVRTDRLKIIENFQLENHKTKKFVQICKAFNIINGLIISTSIDKNLYLAARNLKNILVNDFRSLNPYDLIKFSQTIMTVELIEKIEEWLSE